MEIICLIKYVLVCFLFFFLWLLFLGLLQNLLVGPLYLDKT